MNALVYLASLGRLLQTLGTNGPGARDRHVYKPRQYLRVMIQNL
jgi:hypothetical protein